jgi:biopolymer transport protein ExbD/biopolymer transport protein TolR
MGIDVGGQGKKGGGDKVKPGINITPLVDIVLVLLIIFMVVTPAMTKLFWIQLPKHEEKKAESTPDDKNKPVVLQVTKDGTIKLGADPIEKNALKEKLKRVFAAKNGDHTLFFTADDEAPYGAAVEALDIARAGGAVPISILTEKPKGS